MSRPIRIEVVQQEGGAVLHMTIEGQLIVLDGIALEALIEQFALFRSAMNPPIVDHLTGGQHHMVELDPCWYAEPNPAFDGLVTFFRHSGFGWTGYAIDRAGLTQIKAEMEKFVATADAPAGVVH
jgi:hypothetical protein